MGVNTTDNSTRPHVRVIAFSTEGAPHDSGLDLSSECETLLSYFEDYVDSTRRYSPRILRELGYSSYSKLWEDYTDKIPSPLHSEHLRGIKHGFWGWKPLVILAELRQMRDGDILFYSDCNISRYPYAETAKDVIWLCETMLRLAKVDFALPQHDYPEYPIRTICKKSAFDRFLRPGDPEDILDLDWSFRASQIAIRNSKWSRALVEEWLELCMDDNLIFPELERPSVPGFMWHTHDQALLNVLLIRKIKDGALPPNYPGFRFRGDIGTRSNLLPPHAPMLSPEDPESKSKNDYALLIAFFALLVSVISIFFLSKKQYPAARPVGILILIVGLLVIICSHCIKFGYGPLMYSAVR